jgi:hypothetical protein
LYHFVVRLWRSKAELKSRVINRRLRRVYFLSVDPITALYLSKIPTIEL